MVLQHFLLYVLDDAAANLVSLDWSLFASVVSTMVSPLMAFPLIR